MVVVFPLEPVIPITLPFKYLKPNSISEITSAPFSKKNETSLFVNGTPGETTTVSKDRLFALSKLRSSMP